MVQVVSTHRISIAVTDDRKVTVLAEELSEGIAYGKALHAGRSLAGAIRWCRDNLGISEDHGWSRTAPEGYLRVTPAA